MRGQDLENGDTSGVMEAKELEGISSYSEATVTATECI
jgi:hypothetical protein